MLNDHMILYLTNDLWQKHLPAAIRQEIRTQSDAKEALNVYWTHLEQDGKESFPNLREFLATARENSIDTMRDVWITVGELKEQLNIERSEQFKVHGYMNEKKNYEVTSKGGRKQFHVQAEAVNFSRLK